MRPCRRWAAIVVAVGAATSFAQTLDGTHNPATSASTNERGPRALELQLLGKRIDTVDDVSLDGLGAFNLLQVGTMYNVAGQPAEAIRVATVGLDALQRDEDARPEIGRVLHSVLAAAQAEIGNSDEAEKSFLALLNDEPLGVAASERAGFLLQLAELYRQRGLFQRASDVAESARSLIENVIVPPLTRDHSLFQDTTREDDADGERQIAESMEIAALAGKESLTKTEQERFDSLGKAAQERLERYVQRGQVDSARTLHTNLYQVRAHIMRGANRPTDAAADLDRMMALQRQYHIGLSASELIERARIAQVLGDTSTAQRLYESAHEYAKSNIGARGLPEPLQFPIDQSAIEQVLGRAASSLAFPRAANQLGEVYQALGRGTEARPLYVQARSTFENLLGRKSMLYADSLRRLAELDAQEGNVAAALATIREASSVFQQSRENDLAGLSRRFESYGSAGSAYMLHLSLLANRLTSSPRDSSLIDEALRIVQAASLSQAGAAIEARDLRPADPKLAAIVRSLQDTEHRVVRAERELLAALGGAADNRAELPILKARVEREQSARARVQAALRSTAPHILELMRPEPLSLASARSRLRKEDALILYAIGERQSFGMWLTADQAGLIPLAATRITLDALIHDLRGSLTPVLAGQGHKVPAYDFATALLLEQLLVEPLLAGMSREPTHLYIVPAPPLDSIPFSLLVRSMPLAVSAAERYRDADYLVKSYATTTLPIASNLPVTRTVLPARRAHRVLAFADPSLDESSEKALLLSERGRTLRGSLLAVLPPRDAPTTIGARPQTFSVEAAQNEVEDIFTELQARRDTLFVGPQASEATLRRLNLSPFDVIVFATHALTAHNDLIDEPTLRLSSTGTESAASNDGLLTASEISRLQVRAKLVILSACSTAAPDGTLGAEALSGLTSAFFFAGARALLVSHWDVFSEEAPRITVGMIRELRAGKDAAHALQTAILDILANQRFDEEAHPAYWAPFVLVGG